MVTALAVAVVPDAPVARVCPRTVGDEGPCPFVSCRNHLAVDVMRSRKIGGPSEVVERFEVEETSGDTCAIDVALRGGITLEEAAELSGGLTRERIRQIEEKALGKLRRSRLADEENRPGRGVVRGPREGGEYIDVHRLASERVEALLPEGSPDWHVARLNERTAVAIWNELVEAFGPAGEWHGPIRPKTRQEWGRRRKYDEGSRPPNSGYGYGSQPFRRDRRTAPFPMRVPGRAA